MTTMSGASGSSTRQTDGLLGRVGIPPTISWGFLGVLLFMTGTGLELGWLSPYLVDHGIALPVVAAIFSAYGICVSLASWVSGVLFEIIGAKRTMALAVLLFMAGTAVFVGLGVQSQLVWALFVGYAIKGLSYPLFSYSFLVWIAYRAEPARMSAAYGWFWFAFSGGMSVLGAYGSDLLIRGIGHVPTLWSALLWVGLSAVAMLVLNRDDIRPATGSARRWRQLGLLVTVMRAEPRLLIVLFVRVVNTLPQFAMPIFMPIYLQGLGFDTSEWLSIWGTVWLLNIAFNLVVGYLGDHIGWQRTISLIGGFGSAVSVLAFFYVPQLFGHNYWAQLAAGTALGICIAGFIPLDAVTANLVESRKGAALSILNLGAGLSTLIGPAIVAIFAGLVGYSGVAWILAAGYLMVAVVIWWVVPRRAAVAGA